MKKKVSAKVKLTGCKKSEKTSNKGLKSAATLKRELTKDIMKSSFEFKRWKRVYMIQKDIRAGHTWLEVMAAQQCSRPTVQRALKAVIPEEFLAMLQDTNTKTPATVLATHKAKKSINCTLNPLEFVEDPEMLNFSLFPMQRLILKAFYGIPLDDTKQVLSFHPIVQQSSFKLGDTLPCLTEVGMMNELVNAGKCTWKGLKEYRELVLVVGMKGGKSALAGVLECIEEYSLYKHDDFREHFGLPKGKQVVILSVAANEDQAKKTIFAEVDALIKNSPYYQRRQAPSSNATAFNFEDQNVILQSGHSNSNALVGPLTKAVLLDELDRFANKEGGKSSGMHMYNSISRSVAPFKMSGKIISISSPMSTAGPIIKLFNMSKNEPTMLGFWLATWELNPNLPLEGEVMQADLRKCPEDFWRDFGAQPAHSLEKYYRDRAKIDAVFKRGKERGLKNPIRENGTFEDWFKGNPLFNYHLHMDPSVKNDHFGIAMSHRDGPHVIVDLVHCFKALNGEIDYSMVSEFLDVLVERFPTLTTSTYDVYLAVQLYQSIRKKGVNTEFLRIDKAEHDKLKIETIYNDRLICYDSPEFRRELRDLDLISGRKVDHPSENEEGGRGSKDMADSVAGSVVACIAEGDFTESVAASASVDPVEENRGHAMFEQQGSMFGGDEGGSIWGSGGRRGLIW